jgi:hypothetical protein
MKNNEVIAQHTVRKDKDGNPVQTTFTLIAWEKVRKQQSGNYSRQGRWELAPSVKTPPEAEAPEPEKKKPGRPKKT